MSTGQQVTRFRTCGVMGAMRDLGGFARASRSTTPFSCKQICFEFELMMKNSLAPGRPSRRPQSGPDCTDIGV